MQAHTYNIYTSWEGKTTDYTAYSRNHLIAFQNKPALEVSADVAFRGDGVRHNPEELLVAALSSCHLLSYLALCARNGIELLSYEDSATGTMAMENGAIRFTDVLLRPVCVVRGKTENALRLHDRAHTECFIANSVNFPVRHDPVIRLFEQG